MVSLAPVAIMVQSTRPKYAYGQLATIALHTGGAMFARVGVPAAIAEDSVIISATLVLTQATSVSGSTTVNLRRSGASFRVNTTTWDNQPPLTGSTVTLTKSSPAAGTLWSFDVTADVQAFVAGTVSNYGWRITSTRALSAGLRFRGATASSGQPTLVVDYLEPGEPPEDLFPGGIVSVAKPTLSFLVAPDTSAVQVQVDADTLGAADFDSGEITSIAGQVDLNTTAYAGLASGASTFWRARSRGGTGLTAWSPWATFSRISKPTVAITSPDATTDDYTPPIQWSVSGGTQESWRVIVRNLAGTIVRDSGQIASSATSWTPPLPTTRVENETVSIEVRVWDSVDRVTTPGDPEYATANLDTTLSTSVGVTPPVTVDAQNPFGSPMVLIDATAAAAPDGWAVIRDGSRVFYDASLPTTSFSWNDWSATPGKTHVYRVARVVNGLVSSGGPTVTIKPVVQGIWLVDPEDEVAAVLYDADPGTWTATELAITHQPIAGPPIRRVAYRPPLSGSLTGSLVDTPLKTAAASLASLYDFKSSSASRVLQLVLSDRSIPVNVGDITVNPTPTRGRTQVSFSWWQVDDVPWDS
jgi:hypothetical protein